MGTVRVTNKAELPYLVESISTGVQNCNLIPSACSWVILLIIRDKANKILEPIAHGFQVIVKKETKIIGS